jgi:hypothetical protein
VWQVGEGVSPSLDAIQDIAGFDLNVEFIPLNRRAPSLAASELDLENNNRLGIQCKL